VANIIADDHGLDSVESSVDLGSQIVTTIRLRSGESVELTHAAPEFTSGQSVHVAIRPETITTFPRDSKS
jgi:hypothetical protein